jgi:coatomer protein complex subunit alpha (xenin)
MGTLIDRFEDHDGPVRCVSFHPTQPIFVSGGDDYTIKVWSTQTRKCMFTLTGHLDYVRTVFFHHELPWIISASDDQTIRIWNWQNRKEIACLTGHNHYVMCAQFHPKQDLIVSASLDQTVRVWDISGLIKKHSAPSSNSSFNAHSSMNQYDQFNRNQPPQQDIFGNTDAVVKYVLEGHDKGVNWASFHPELPLIVSGGDDRSVKVWRMSETRAWEVDGCRGHTNNVPCVLFHPTEDLIISVGEDKTIRTWDLNSRSPVKQFKRENDRFWMIVAHPNINLFAACHDSGVMVFKLDRERPASTLNHQTQELFFINNSNQVQKYNYNSNSTSLPFLSMKKLTSPWNKVKNISYNPSENSMLIQSGDNDNGHYAHFSLPKEIVGALEPSTKGEGKANSAYFIARNRYVTFLKSSHKLDIHDLNDNITKSITLDSDVKDIIPATPGCILLLKPTNVVLYDVQQKKEVAVLQMNNAKYAVWSNDNQYLALLSKHTIVIVNKKFETVMSMHETIRIKSAAWDDTGVLIYSTLNHIKYVLLNGDKGTIRTLENTMYITKVSNTKCYCLNRKGEVECLTIDPTEYRFKKALVNKKFNEVLRIIKNSNLVGENIIAYLKKSGYPEVALQFVEDPESRFDLAIECHNLNVALDEAKKINSKIVWEKLGKEALTQGNIQIVELVYQQLHLLDKLSFLYLTLGNTSKLSKMATIAENRQDISSLFTNSIYLGDVERKIQTFLHSGLTPLAYATAKSNGLDDLAESILQEAGVSLDDVSLPADFKQSNPLDVLKPINTDIKNWPLSEAKLSFFEQALSGNFEALQLDDVNNSNLDNEIKQSEFVNNEFDDGFLDEEPIGDDDAWDLGDEELNVELDEGDEDDDTANQDTSKLPDELKNWVKNAKTAGAYIAAGKFEVAASMLNKQAGIKNFEPFKERFMEIYTSSKLSISTFDEDGINGCIPVYINDVEKLTNDNKVLGLVPGYDELESLVQEGYKLFKANQLEDSIGVFRKIIYIIATLSLSNDEEDEKCKEILKICKEYIIGLRIELARRALPATEVKRNLELAAYFTHAELQPAHRLNALQVAMTQSFKAKNYHYASYFASEFLKIMPNGSRADQAKKIQAKADSIATDAIAIDFDPFADWEICAGDFVPIYKGEEILREKILGVGYSKSWKGKICEVTLVSEIGGLGSGLRLKN